MAEFLFNHPQDALRHFSHTKSINLESFLEIYKKVNSCGHPPEKIETVFYRHFLGSVAKPAESEGEKKSDSSTANPPTPTVQLDPKPTPAARVQQKNDLTPFKTAAQLLQEKSPTPSDPSSVKPPHATTTNKDYPSTPNSPAKSLTNESDPRPSTPADSIIASLKALPNPDEAQLKFAEMQRDQAVLAMTLAPPPPIPRTGVPPSPSYLDEIEDHYDVLKHHDEQFGSNLYNKKQRQQHEEIQAVSNKMKKQSATTPLPTPTTAPV